MMARPADLNTVKLLLCKRRDCIPALGEGRLPIVARMANVSCSVSLEVEISEVIHLINNNSLYVFNCNAIITVGQFFRLFTLEMCIAINKPRIHNIMCHIQW